MSDRTDLHNVTLVGTNWDRVRIWRIRKDSIYHKMMVEGPWKDLVAFTHTSIAQFDNTKSPAQDAWRIVFNTLRTDLKGDDVVILCVLLFLQGLSYANRAESWARLGLARAR